MVPFFVYTGVILALPLFFSAPETTVILLDHDAPRNGVVVTTQAGSVELDEPFSATTVRAADTKPVPAYSVEESFVRERYAPVLEALPAAPVSMLFYFESGGAELTAESKAQTRLLVELIHSREPCAVDIIGHTDTLGLPEANRVLGVRRAAMVQTFLEGERVQMSAVSVTSHGEADLLVPTPDEVDEPRNRRVEVIVR